MAATTRRVAVTGVLAALAAVLATTLVAALARAAGVDFEVPDDGGTIPLSGIAVVTGFFSLLGTAVAAGLLRWSSRPDVRFVWTTVSLTAVSLLPPLLSGARAATVSALLVLHVVPAIVMIPTLARSLQSVPHHARTPARAAWTTTRDVPVTARPVRGPLAGREWRGPSSGRPRTSATTRSGS